MRNSFTHKLIKTATGLLLYLILLVPNFLSADVSKLNPKLGQFGSTITKEFGSIPEDRNTNLNKLALFITSKIKAKEKVNLVFICTHNSRRSHMSQIMAKTASIYYDIPGVETYSGGTEATAFNPRAIKALQKAGVDISTNDESKNPKYKVNLGKPLPTFLAYSKKYSDSKNPNSNFAAVLTCSQADKNCPNVEGAVIRISLPFEDPKEFDNTPEEEAKYDERLKDISREMFKLFALVKENLK
ncbi:low molecular weight phosphotyrosine protein phosphatase domain protein [Leptospira broomii serovar Hurstbridge str. 5399]|uniref:Low molecular weight phosphotyrosine protein phosphatase domain protein n=1 Tax=Leptospira broomii serovar Hurstbridge str. 5399 TaxID=1049789 RepID=T0F8G9_9LEPT|nr:protein-tyrosine-phosphatase [Leptospira broomii]EQA44211.1 low molecular weight phosphotyrosine protein phosphatase domain protein [Leptospira broomii serovar Hurstbridge str. 5399]TGM09675.1 protein-tyrosine-phosphatase [Leptospira yasudae]